MRPFEKTAPHRPLEVNAAPLCGHRHPASYNVTSDV